MDEVIPSTVKALSGGKRKITEVIFSGEVRPRIRGFCPRDPAVIVCERKCPQPIGMEIVTAVSADSGTNFPVTTDWYSK